jgi:hypothetical protein
LFLASFYQGTKRDNEGVFGVVIFSVIIIIIIIIIIIVGTSHLIRKVLQCEA